MSACLLVVMVLLALEVFHPAVLPSLVVLSAQHHRFIPAMTFRGCYQQIENGNLPLPKEIISALTFLEVSSPICHIS